MYDPDAVTELINERTDCEALPPFINRMVGAGESSRNLRLHGTVRIDGELDLRGGSLHVEAGTTILMGPNSSIWIEGSGSRVDVLGTPERPVRFCGVTPGQGTWGGLLLGTDLATDSALRHAVVGGAGAEETAVALQSPITMEGLRVLDSGSDGITIGAAHQVTDLFVERSRGAAVVVKHRAALRALNPMMLRANGTDAVKLAFDPEIHGISGREDEPITVRRLGVPYLVTEMLSVESGVLAFEAGAEVRFGPKAGIQIEDPSTAELRVLGRADAPVVFRGTNAVPGAWEGIHLDRTASARSTLQHVLIQDAHRALTSHVSASLDHVIAARNVQGIAIGPAGVSPQSTRIEATDNAGLGLLVHPNALVALPREVHLVRNGHDWIEVDAAVRTFFAESDVERSGTIRNLGVPYHVNSPLAVRREVALTVEAGTHFVMARDAYVDIGNEFEEAVKFVVVGTREHPVRFTGETSVPGFWQVVRVGRRVQEGTRFDFVEFHDAGREGRGVVELNKDVPITNSKFVNYLGKPVLAPSESTVDYQASNTF